MKTISDIRLFKSEFDNVDGNSQPKYFDDKGILATVHRIVMKLRENGFSLGDFDHLYINFTVCNVDNEIAPSKRSVDKYHSWYRFYDVKVDEDLFNKLESPEIGDVLISLIKDTLVKCFATSEFTAEKIGDCVNEAVTYGENMLMKFKEKQSSKSKAVIYLRCLDNMKYKPLLKVLDLNGNLLLERDLPELRDLNAIGDICLNTKRITIKPRKNAFSQFFEPISFDINY